MRKFRVLVFFNFFFVLLINLATAQVQDTVLKNQVDSLKSKPITNLKNSQANQADTTKPKYINPGKVAGRNAMIKSLIIPGWGQLYNNQILVRDYKAKGESGGHFWQKTYTLGKVGVIYTGFTLLTLSYIDNSNNYRLLLKEAQYRALNQDKKENPDLIRYTTSYVTTAKDIAKRNKQVVIFSMAAVYLANVADAYVAARLHYFNIDDNLSFKVTPTLINSTNGLYGFNTAPAIKFSLIL